MTLEQRPNLAADAAIVPTALGAAAFERGAACDTEQDGGDCDASRSDVSMHQAAIFGKKVHDVQSAQQREQRG
jgi:hypothetical protein